VELIPGKQPTKKTDTLFVFTNPFNKFEEKR
jgi:hypothetical protein